MADPQVLLKHNITGLTALFPAAADLDTWRALGWHEIPDEPPGDPASADESEKTKPRGEAAPKRGNEPKEQV